MGRNGNTIKERVTLVTGSGRGLGAAVARAAAGLGAPVVLNCRSAPREAEAVAHEIEKGGGRALAVRADVSDYAQAQALVAETVKAFGRVDILVNAVEAFSWKTLDEMEPQEWRCLMSMNLDSVYHMCRLVLPLMRKGHWGRIVNLGTVGAECTLGQPKVAAYSAAKSAVIALSKALALEEARHGITVNVVSPGVFIAEGSGPEEPPKILEDRVPVGRPGTLEDVVRSVLFFASPAADFVTGQVLAVAGGWRG